MVEIEKFYNTKKGRKITVLIIGFFSIIFIPYFLGVMTIDESLMFGNWFIGLVVLFGIFFAGMILSMLFSGLYGWVVKDNYEDNIFLLVTFIEKKLKHYINI